MALNSADPPGMAQRDAELSRAIGRERPRLWRYIRRRVSDDADAEDILQDVLGELLEAYRALQPIEKVGAWLMRVARNRLIDRFRARRPELGAPPPAQSADGAEELSWEQLLPDPSAGPAAAYARDALLAEMQLALDELPPLQREAFTAHEFDGESFADMSARTGVGISTLLARKHYAVRHLRERLAALRDQLMD